MQFGRASPALGKLVRLNRALSQVDVQFVKDLRSLDRVKEVLSGDGRSCRGIRRRRRRRRG